MIFFAQSLFFLLSHNVAPNFHGMLYQSSDALFAVALFLPRLLSMRLLSGTLASIFFFFFFLFCF